MRKKTLLRWTAASAAMLCVWSFAGADDERVAKIMRDKLERSQKVLEGLALEDYAVIAKNADQLAVLSQAAAWNVLQTPEYASYSGLHAPVAKAGSHGEGKNLDGATLAYVELTINCVACHRYVRGVERAALPVGNDRSSLALAPAKPKRLRNLSG